MRIPKSASTVLWLNLIGCCRKSSDARCCRNSVRIHDHRDGCRDLQRCNGTALVGERPFIILREPTARFRSVAAHVRRVIVDAADPLYQMSDAALATWLRDATVGCRDAHCRVAAVNERYAATHRVVLWPQAFWAGRDPLVVCFDPDNLVARVNAVLKEHCASCLIKSGAAENVPASEAPGADVDVTDLYGDDYALWARHCAPLNDGVGHERWRMGRWA